MRSNSAGNETKVRLEDEWGTVIYERNGLGANQLYRDTLFLGLGCYSLKIEDSDDDGIDFWNNSDGVGFIRIMEVGGGILKTFEGDFGKSSTLNFTVNHLLKTEKIAQMGYKCYPNPTTGRVTLAGYDLAGTKVSLINNLGQTLNVPTEITATEVQFDLSNQPSGIYFVTVLKNNVRWTEKLILQ